MVETNGLRKKKGLLRTKEESSTGKTNLLKKGETITWINPLVRLDSYRTEGGLRIYYKRDLYPKTNCQGKKDCEIFTT